MFFSRAKKFGVTHRWLNHVGTDPGSSDRSPLSSLAFVSPPLRCEIFMVVRDSTSAFWAADGKLPPNKSQDKLFCMVESSPQGQRFFTRF